MCCRFNSCWCYAVCCSLWCWTDKWICCLINKTAFNEISHSFVAGSGDAQTIVLTGFFIILDILLIVFSMVANRYNSLMSRPVRAVWFSGVLQVQFLLVLCCLLQSVVLVQSLTTSPASSASIERVGFSTFSFIHKSFLLMNSDGRFKFLGSQSLVQWCVAGSIPAGVMPFAAVCGVGPKTDYITSIYKIRNWLSDALPHDHWSPRIDYVIILIVIYLRQ